MRRESVPRLFERSVRITSGATVRRLSGRGNLAWNFSSGEAEYCFGTPLSNDLTNAAKEPPNFAGHYRFTFWGCGSNCAAGAVIDLQTGTVYPPPLGDHGDGWSRWMIAATMSNGSAIDFHPDSRLVVVRGGINYSERLKANIPDVWYFVWERDRFRQLLFKSGKDSGR